MKTMSPRKFVLFSFWVAAFIAGVVFVGMHISLPAVPLESTAVIIVGGFLLWLCAREMICVPLKDSFLVDGDGTVIAYHDTNQFARTRVLNESGCSVVPHVFAPVLGERDARFARRDCVVQASVRVRADADRNQLQKYFDAFLCDRWVHPPEEKLKRMLSDFLDAHSEWLGNVPVLGARLIENKLSDWLDERLPSVGLRCRSVECKLDIVSNVAG